MVQIQQIAPVKGKKNTSYAELILMSKQLMISKRKEYKRPQKESGQLT